MSNTLPARQKRIEQGQRIDARVLEAVNACPLIGTNITELCSLFHELKRHDINNSIKRLVKADKITVNVRVKNSQIVRQFYPKETPRQYYKMQIIAKNVLATDDQDAITKIYKALDAVGIKAVFVESCEQQDAFDKEPLSCEDEYKE